MKSNENKRFWTSVEVIQQEAGFAIHLDGKPLRVPGAGVLWVAGRVLAEAIAAEWRAAGDGAPGGGYGPEAVGLTRLAGAMLFRVGSNRAAAIERLGAFLDNELLCYRATHPRPLVARQQRDWQPWLDWCRTRFGAALASTDGLMPIRQVEAAQAAIDRALRSLDDAALTALGVLVPALSSLVLGLACVDGALSTRDAHALSLLDDHFQAEQWGRDAEAAQRENRVLADCLEAERFVSLARGVEAAPALDTLLLVKGRVQGVGFRAWLQSEARRLGLRGWVRNLADGRVEARLSGPAAARGEMARLAETGPGGAVVRSVAAREVAADRALGATAAFAVLETAPAPLS